MASYAEAVGRGQVLRVGIVAGETSGDRLGGGVVAALRQRCPEISVRGVGGEALAAQGLQSICNMHDISIMGTDGLLGKLRRALAVRQQLYREFVADPPDVFLGIDVPDFNLGLERRLRRTAIPIVHLVSPTVWAWRAYRLRKIRHAVDRMLVLFPFEETWYRERGVAATFVGHPAADETAAIDRDQARAELAIPPGLKIVARRPGRRGAGVLSPADTPRGENPAATRAGILAACPGAREIGDRREAIAAAVAGLQPCDILVIAGKGHETEQVFADRTIEFDDVAVASAWLQERFKRSLSVGDAAIDQESGS